MVELGDEGRWHVHFATEMKPCNVVERVWGHGSVEVERLVTADQRRSLAEYFSKAFVRADGKRRYRVSLGLAVRKVTRYFRSVHDALSFIHDVAFGQRRTVEGSLPRSDGEPPWVRVEWDTMSGSRLLAHQRSEAG